MGTKRHQSNFVNEEINPCIKSGSRHTPYSDTCDNSTRQEESNLSTKCLEENNYVQEKCVDYFKNYQVCKQFWSKVANARRKKGIKPHMPGSVEREKILKEADENNKFVYAAV